MTCCSDHRQVHIINTCLIHEHAIGYVIGDISLIEVWVQACHWHVHSWVECITPLAQQCPLRVLPSIPIWLICLLELLKLIWWHKFEVLPVVLSHSRGLSHILRVEVRPRDTWDMRRLHSFLKYGLPVDISAPWVGFDAADLTFSDPAAWVFM